MSSEQGYLILLQRTTGCSICFVLLLMNIISALECNVFTIIFRTVNKLGLKDNMTKSFLLSIMKLSDVLIHI